MRFFNFPTLGLKRRKRCEIVLKRLSPPVGFALTHTHAHSQICGNLTLGASLAQKETTINYLSFAAVMLCGREITKISIYLVIFSF